MINGGSGNENLVGGFGNDAHLNKSKITQARSHRPGMRKSDNTIAIQAMSQGRKKDVGEFEKPNCDARGAAIA
ncbi:hypothetical protein [Nostoc sp.]|uniref:hypothetical protein n=1 Tax=Nostoc sp. TaxID=1180 RepID=UPI002FF2031F